MALSPGFLTIGVINASLNRAGKSPTDSDQVNSSVMIRAVTSATCFETDVVIGSAADDLFGSRWIAAMTSSVVAGENIGNDVSVTVIMAHACDDMNE